MLTIEQKQLITELESDFEEQIKSLEGIVYNNLSALFFDVVLIKYDNNDTKKINLCKWNATKNLRDLKRMLFKEKIFYKNIIKKENIYFAVTAKTKFLNFIWLDDIKLENVSEKQLPFLTLIETSQNNYQAWIKLDKVYTENRVQQIKHYLIKTLKADKAAAAKIQPARLPGFYSYKRMEPYYVKVYKVADKVLNGEKLLKKITGGKQQAQEKSVKTAQIITKKVGSWAWAKYSYYKKELGLIDTKFDPVDERDIIIQYFQQGRKKEGEDIQQKKEDIELDYNIVDIHYIYQLVIRDYEKKEIFEFLSKVRKDLSEKHTPYDYFERTYLKALLFKKMFFPELKLFDNRLLLKFIELQKEKGNYDTELKVAPNLEKFIMQVEAGELDDDIQKIKEENLIMKDDINTA